MRYEFKYLINKNQLDFLRSILNSRLDLDKFTGENLDYTVRSIYFDSFNLMHYTEKKLGMSHRQKVRMRGYNYNSDSDVFLEIKRKYQDPSTKNRYKCSYQKALSIIENKISSEDNESLKRFLYRLNTYKLRPLVNVIYDREPYTEKLPTKNNLRITLDKNLRSVAFPKITQLFDDINLAYTFRDLTILEIKFNISMPLWVRNMIESLGVRRTGVSKYILCMEQNSNILVNSHFSYLRAENL